jgi:HIT domain-containing protein
MTRTWPEDWEARKEGAGCWFCGGHLGEPFYAGSVGDAHLESHPIAPGHAIVVFRDRHVADFTRLSAAEVAAYWRDIHTVAQMIERVFAPCHMNYQLLGNWCPTCTCIWCRGTWTILLQASHCRGSPSLSRSPNTTGKCGF